MSIQASYRLELKLYAQLAKQKSHRITHRGLSWRCGFDVSFWKQNQICGDFRMLSWMKGHSTWRPRPWTCHWNCGKAVAISFFVGCSLKSPWRSQKQKIALCWACGFPCTNADNIWLWGAGSLWTSVLFCFLRAADFTFIFTGDNEWEVSLHRGETEVVEHAKKT